MPVYIRETGEGQPLLYGFPFTGPDSEGVKVGLHGSDVFCSPESIDRIIRPADERIIRARVAEALPLLAGRLLHAETCLYTMTPDEHFVIDKHPEFSQVTLAAGFSGHGFKFARLGKRWPNWQPAARQSTTLDFSPLDVSRIFPWQMAPFTYRSAGEHRGENEQVK